MANEHAEIAIAITFRQTESTEALKAYATEKITQLLKKYVHKQADVKVILSVQKRDHQAEVIVHSKDYDVTGRVITEDLYSAIDKVVDTLSTQLRKKKEQLVDHHRTQVQDAIG
jgi:putative sigma-54 modulation protein